MCATILYPDGTQQVVTPRNGRDFQLKELQDIVGGFIELVPTRDSRTLVVNEEGKLEGLPRNEQATALVDFPSPAEIREMLAAHSEIIFVGDLDEPDYVAGTVLLCESREVR